MASRYLRLSAACCCFGCVLLVPLVFMILHPFQVCNDYEDFGRSLCTTSTTTTTSTLPSELHKTCCKAACVVSQGEACSYEIRSHAYSNMKLCCKCREKVARQGVAPCCSVSSGRLSPGNFCGAHANLKVSECRFGSDVYPECFHGRSLDAWEFARSHFEFYNAARFRFTLPPLVFAGVRKALEEMVLPPILQRMVTFDVHLVPRPLMLSDHKVLGDLYEVILNNATLRMWLNLGDGLQLNDLRDLPLSVRVSEDYSNFTIETANALHVHAGADAWARVNLNRTGWKFWTFEHGEHRLWSSEGKCTGEARGKFRAKFSIANIRIGRGPSPELKASSPSIQVRNLSVGVSLDIPKGETRFHKWHFSFCTRFGINLCGNNFTRWFNQWIVEPALAYHLPSHEYLGHGYNYGTRMMEEEVQDALAEVLEQQLSKLLCSRPACFAWVFLGGWDGMALEQLIAAATYKYGQVAWLTCGVMVSILGALITLIYDCIRHRFQGNFGASSVRSISREYTLSRDHSLDSVVDPECEELEDETSNEWCFSRTTVGRYMSLLR